MDPGGSQDKEIKEMCSAYAHENRDEQEDGNRNGTEQVGKRRTDGIIINMLEVFQFPGGTFGLFIFPSLPLLILLRQRVRFQD